MHNNIMATGSRDRPPMLATGRYAQWKSRFLRYIYTRPNGDALRKCILQVVDTILNISPKNKAHYESEKEAIHLLLTGIGDEIYSTVDSCKTAHEMWIAIERLQQGESLNIQDVKTNLFWEFGKFTSHDGESMESYYFRFYKMMSEMIRNNFTVATIQYQKEVNEIRAERIAKNANPLALVTAASPYPDPYYQAPKSHKLYAPTSKQSSSTRSNASTKYKGKEIAKPITPLFESAFEEESDPDKLREIRICKKTWHSLQSTLNRSTNLPTTTSELLQTQETRMWILLQGSQVVQQTGIQCFNCKKFGHFAKECRKPKRVKDYSYQKENMLLCKQAEKGVPLQAEQADWLVDTDEEIDEQELKAHYSYMAKIQEVLTADSRTDTEPLEQVQYDAKYNVFANERHHSEQLEYISNICVVEKIDSNVIPDSPDMCDNDIQTDQNAEDERVALANLIANLKLDVDENKKIQKQLKKANTSLAHELKECKSILTETSRTLGESNSIRELVDQAWEKHSHDHFRAPTAHDMEILIKTCLMPLALKTQNDSFKFVHELKQEMHADLKYVESLEKEIDELESYNAEFSNMYDILLQECVSNDVMCSYLHLLSDLDAHTELQCLYLHKVKEYEFCKEKASNVFLKKREQYFEIQDLKAQLQDKNIAISELEKLIEKCEGKSVETKFDKPSVVRQPNAQRIPKPSILGKPTPFSDSLERKKIQRQRVIHITNISRPQLRSTQMKDKVVPNNSQVKFKKIEVEDHHRISSISNKTKSVTACNNSLKSRTSNVNVVCATCEKCVFNSNHDACVSKFLNDVNARTKKPKVVPISTRKPKRQANKFVATPPKKTVASKSTIQKSKSYYKMLYEKTIRNENVQKRVSFAIDNASRITNIIQPILFIVDSGCTKHMTGNLKLLCNFVEKYLGNITINRVYYVEGLNHSLFSVGQFYDADLEVAFRKSTCFVRDLQVNDLLTGNHRSDLYTISLQEMSSLTPIYFMAKASPTQAWLWHRRLSHLNFDYINLLSKKDVVIGLPKLKYVKDQPCSSCEVSKAKRSSFKTKVVLSSKGRQSKGYRVYNKRTRLIVESIHIRLDEIKQMSETSVANNTSHTTAPSQQELDLLFDPLYDEFFTAGTSSVNKSFPPTDNSKQQDTPPKMDIQSSTEQTTPTNVNAEENNDN
ncbi:retrovirus-related pol polyprotein from transposon TNT 1-94 [Tanacetum coccineum]